jgi:hypothetical protein
MAGAYIVAPHLRWQTSLPLANNDEALQLPAGTPKSSIEAMTTVAAAKSPLQQPLTQMDSSSWLYDAEGQSKRNSCLEVSSRRPIRTAWRPWWADAEEGSLESESFNWIAFAGRLSLRTVHSKS